MIDSYDSSGNLTQAPAPTPIAASTPEGLSNGTDVPQTHETAHDDDEATTKDAGSDADAQPTGEQSAGTVVDHFAAIHAVLPTDEMDRLASRVVAAGGAAGVDLSVTEGSAMEAGKLTEHIVGVQSELQSMADEHVKAQGVDPEAFYTFVRKQGKQVLNATGLMLYHSKNAAMALDPLIREFRRTAASRGLGRR